MGRVKFYENFEMEIPGSFEPMSEEERAMYFGSIKVDNCYIDKEHKAVFTVSENDFELNDENLEGRLGEYIHAYSRMSPGYEKGEILKAKDNRYALFTFKSNALTRDLFNIVSIIKNDGKEVVFNASFDIKDSFKMLPSFRKAIESTGLKKSTQND